MRTHIREYTAQEVAVDISLFWSSTGLAFDRRLMASATHIVCAVHTFSHSFTRRMGPKQIALSSLSRFPMTRQRTVSRLRSDRDFMHSLQCGSCNRLITGKAHRYRVRSGATDCNGEKARQLQDKESIIKIQDIGVLNVLHFLSYCNNSTSEIVAARQWTGKTVIDFRRGPYILSEVRTNA